MSTAFSVAGVSDAFVEPNPAWSASMASRIEQDWHVGEWDPQTLVFTGDPDNPQTWLFRCTVVSCGGVTQYQGLFCERCRGMFDKRGRPADFAKHFTPAGPAPSSDAARRFRLGGLPDGLQVEVLFALQAYTRDRVLVPARVKRLLDRLPAGTRSLLDVPDTFDRTLQFGERGLLRALRSVLLRDRASFDGTDVTLGDVWDCNLLGLQAGTYRPYTAQLGTVLDFRSIQHRWLRELAKEYVRATRPTVHKARPTIQACAIASRALLARPDGDHPDRLRVADMSAIVEYYESQRIGDRLMSASQRSQLFFLFKGVLDFGRRSGLMDAVPGSFVPPAQTRLQRGSAKSEDMAGRALPVHVVAQLDAHLHLLGAESNYVCAGWAAEDLRFMHRTIYQVLRDTGRRPEEVYSLKRGCVQRVDDKPSLIYDNHKAGRANRRLPITESTARIVEEWQAHLDQLSLTGDSPWLFPAPGARGQLARGQAHIRNWGNRTLRNWVASIPALTDVGLDDNGLSVAFARDRVVAYAFRHTYAQRHADAGTPVDVLRQLMDHVSIDTTMGYYQVTMTRRREAVTTVSSLMVDRDGHRVPPVGQVEYEMGTVTVPFGNCAEPSNVKAGGGHCPIRFQCAGCSFYRPDPSYLPALEAHVAELRVNKEHALATDAAGWVVTNLQDQVDAFATVAGAMRTLLDDLPDDERQGVEDASVEVRKLRQLNASMLGRTP